MKLMIAMIFGFTTASSFAHEIGSQDRKNMNWLAQMARSHAVKMCSDRPEFASCRKQHIRALAETAATIPGLAGIPPTEFVALIERQALTSNYTLSQTSAVLDTSAVDCRIDVC